MVTHSAKDMDPAEKQAATEKMRETIALSPAPVASIASPEKLLAAMATRFLAGETIPADLRTRFQQAAGEKIPFTDSAIRKMILAMVQSPLYQVT